MDAAKDIGSALVACRRSRGLTQSELGSRIGVPQQQIARWERDAYANVSLSRVVRVASELGYPLARLADVPVAAETQAGYGIRPPATDLGSVIARIRAAGAGLRDEFGLRSVSVYGSFVDGAQSDDSDVDLIVEADDRSPADEYTLMRHFGHILGRPVDVTYPDLIRWEIRDDVLREAVRVWSA